MSEFFDQVSGTPCANCEDEPAQPTKFSNLFCSVECQAEYEGWDDDDPTERQAAYDDMYPPLDLPGGYGS